MKSTSAALKKRYIVWGGSAVFAGAALFAGIAAAAA
jgi:hypothetical protein